MKWNIYEIKVSDVCLRQLSLVYPVGVKGSGGKKSKRNAVEQVLRCLIECWRISSWSFSLSLVSLWFSEAFQKKKEANIPPHNSSLLKVLFSTNVFQKGLNLNKISQNKSTGLACLCSVLWTHVFHWNTLNFLVSFTLMSSWQLLFPAGVVLLLTECF